MLLQPPGNVMRRLTLLISLSMIFTCAHALAGSYCENYMPDDYALCNKAMNSGSHKTYGNWHLSMAGKNSELQLYPFNPAGQVDLALVVGCDNAIPLAILRPYAPLADKGILKIYARSQLLWEGSWDSNRVQRFMIADFQTLIKRLSEKGVDTVKMMLLPNGIKSSFNVQTYHTLGSDRAMRALQCRA